MFLSDYLSLKSQNRRILIVSDISRAHSLLKQYEKNTGDLNRNVNCMTLNQLITALYYALISTSGYTDKFRQLDDTEAMMFFRSTVMAKRNELKYFTDERMLNLAMTKEMYRKAKLIRSNGWSGEEKKAVNSRVDDLKLLISEYEKVLEGESLMDNVGMLKYVLAAADNGTDLKAIANTALAAEISYLTEDVDRYTGLQKKLLSVLTDGTDCTVCVFDNEPSMSSLVNCRGKAAFYRGYGRFNEANYIANDILNDKLPFGDVQVLITSTEQLPAVSAALRGNGISMKVTSNYSLKDNAYVSLVKRIIAWADDDFSEKALENIMASPVICAEEELEDGSKKNLLAGQAYYNYVLNARDRREDSFTLGWGYARNCEFIEHERTIPDKSASILEMHAKLLDIFGENGEPYDEQKKVRPITIYKNLVEFVKTYSYASQEQGIAIESLRRLYGAVEFEAVEMTLSDCLQYIIEMLDELSISDEADPRAVTVQVLNDWCVPDRRYVYLMGLSLKDMQGNMVESPVLSDHELETYLFDGFVPTLKNKAELREKNILRSLGAFSGELITFGYSSYDTVTFCESNPSNVYREALACLGDDALENLIEFVYGNPCGLGGMKNKNVLTLKTSADVKLHTSNSALERLLECPKKYAFSDVLYIPENQYSESNYSKWLDAKCKGSFFHEIAERYVKEKLIKPSNEIYPDTADGALVDELANELKVKMLRQMPVAFNELADRETEQLAEAAKKYLNRLHAKLCEEKCRVLMAEQSFKDAQLQVTDYNGQVFDFVVNGIIDRIDYRLDSDKHKVLLRISDYKTGKKSSKEKADRQGKLIQYLVYEEALMNSGMVEVAMSDGTLRDVLLLDYVKDKIVELENNSALFGWSYEFEWFDYIFPMDAAGVIPLRIEAGALKYLNLSRLRSILTITEINKYYPDHMDLFKAVKDDYSKNFAIKDPNLSYLAIALREGDTDNIAKEEISDCRYCSYQYLCEKKKAGII